MYVPVKRPFFSLSPFPEIAFHVKRSFDRCSFLKTMFHVKHPFSCSTFLKFKCRRADKLCKCRRVDIFARPVTRHSRRRSARASNHVMHSNAAAVLFPTHSASFECSALLSNAMGPTDVRARLREVGVEAFSLSYHSRANDANVSFRAEWRGDFFLVRSCERAAPRSRGISLRLIAEPSCLGCPTHLASKTTAKSPSKLSTQNSLTASGPNRIYFEELTARINL